MKDWTAAEILAIPESDPEQLFSSPTAYHDEFHELAKRWHPDASDEKRAHEVFAHLTALHRAAKAKGATRWEYPGRLTVKGGGVEWTMRFAKKHTFELGEMYLGRTQVAWAVKREFDDLFANALRAFGTFPYASPEMEKEVSRYLPPRRWFSLVTNDRQYVALDKTEDLILAGDLLAHLGDKIDPKHVAWIVSSLLNLACYFKYAGITHNAIGLDSYFVSPVYHSGALLGGWWYSARVGTKMAALPSRSYVLAPPDITRTKVANSRLDLGLIRQTAAALLGGVDNAPAPMRKWLSYASDGNPIRDYTEWRQVLQDSFGARRFVEMKVSASDVYG